MSKVYNISMSIPPRKYTTTLIQKEVASNDAYSFSFAKPRGFQYDAGQYVRMIINSPNPDNRGNSRFFTLSSSPSEDHLMITTRIIQSSFKKTLSTMSPGTNVDIFGPLGNFTLQQSDTGTRVFLAGGIGITPFRSITKYAADNRLKVPMVLFTSFRTTEDVIFGNELREIAAKNSWFKLVESTTRPEESKKPWTGRIGRIDEKILSEEVADIHRSLFYISGPPAMVDDLTTLIKSMDVDTTKIKVEKFSGY